MYRQTKRGTEGKQQKREKDQIRRRETEERGREEGIEGKRELTDTEER
jgi:hypothetical protein